jgi:hypothetical protein
MKLSDKDKLLLKWLLLFIGLFVTYQFIYLPIQTNLSLKESELQELIIQKELTEITLPTYDTVMKREEETRDLLDQKFSLFFDEFKAEDLETYLNPLLTQYNASISYFQASITQVVIPEVLKNEEEVLNYKIKLLLDEYEKNNQDTTEIELVSSDLLKTIVSYRIDISFTNYQALIQDLSLANTSIILSKTDYNFDDRSANMEFDVYSLQKPSVKP